jgi:hypothetical protein
VSRIDLCGMSTGRLRVSSIVHTHEPQQIFKIVRLGPPLSCIFQVHFGSMFTFLILHPPPPALIGSSG